MSNTQRDISEFAPFGECCEDLKKCITIPQNTFFFLSEEKTLFFSVGYANTEQGTAWFDQAIIYCPFCGTKIQDEEKIAKKVSK